eukprot:TRINITY_DN16697_c0_g1_i2.p1 TRINITY_DN16697_c0_g1~~TRINITY_DN16697_c0_g1_i2.p1  ORF type:complete len:465 (-),score=25.03 TRINITY_DN16697_c0_g1_i2:225-1553(-)
MFRCLLPLLLAPVALTGRIEVESEGLNPQPAGEDSWSRPRRWRRWRNETTPASSGNSTSAASDSGSQWRRRGRNATTSGSPRSSTSPATDSGSQWRRSEASGSPRSSTDSGSQWRRRRRNATTSGSRGNGAPAATDSGSRRWRRQPTSEFFNETAAETTDASSQWFGYASRRKGRRDAWEDGSVSPRASGSASATSGRAVRREATRDANAPANGAANGATAAAADNSTPAAADSGSQWRGFSTRRRPRREATATSEGSENSTSDTGSWWTGFNWGQREAGSEGSNGTSAGTQSATSVNIDFGYDGDEDKENKVDEACKAVSMEYQQCNKHAIDDQFFVDCNYRGNGWYEPDPEETFSPPEECQPFANVDLDGKYARSAVVCCGDRKGSWQRCCRRNGRFQCLVAFIVFVVIIVCGCLSLLCIRIGGKREGYSCSPNEACCGF